MLSIFCTYAHKSIDNKRLCLQREFYNSDPVSLSCVLQSTFNFCKKSTDPLKAGKDSKIHLITFELKVRSRTSDEKGEAEEWSPGGIQVVQNSSRSLNGTGDSKSVYPSQYPHVQTYNTQFNIDQLSEVAQFSLQV